MSTGGAPAQRPIALPEWYARFAPGGHSTAARSPDGDDDRLHLGPLTIYRPSSGCEVATDGPSGQRVIAIVDGYLFDRTALEGELGCPAGAGQAELVASAYRRWGASMFDRLDGCYLIAV